jgi:hypothetical protein
MMLLVQRNDSFERRFLDVKCFVTESGVWAVNWFETNVISFDQMIVGFQRRRRARM